MGLQPTNRFTSALTLVVLAAIATMTVGCVPNYTDHKAFVKSPKPVVGGKPYIVEPPDSLRIIAPNAPELHDQQVTLRPDGYITLYLVGDHFAAGKTPMQIAGELEQKVTKYYQDVTVQVEVVGFNSKVYYVAGETRNGPMPYTGKDTVLDALLRSGIPRTSLPSKALVLRPDGKGGVTKRMTINLNDMIKRGDIRNNAVLEEGDILYLPTNPFATVGYAVQNLLLPVNPILQGVATPTRAAAAASGVPN